MTDGDRGHTATFRGAVCSRDHPCTCMHFFLDVFGKAKLIAGDSIGA